MTISEDRFQPGETVFRAKVSMKTGRVNVLYDTLETARYGNGVRLRKIGGWLPTWPCYHDGAGWGRTEEQAVALAMEGLRKKVTKLGEQYDTAYAALKKAEESQ